MKATFLRCPVSALDSERLTHLRQRARSIGEHRKGFEFVSEKYGRESINTEDYIPHPSVVRSRPLDVDRSCSSHDYLSVLMNGAQEGLDFFVIDAPEPWAVACGELGFQLGDTGFQRRGI